MHIHKPACNDQSEFWDGPCCGRISALPASPQISTPCFSGVLRAERANVNRFNGFHAAVSATLDKAAMRPVRARSCTQTAGRSVPPGQYRPATASLMQPWASNRQVEG